MLESDLLICDENQGMCIAGVFGGLESGVTESTKNVFLESAYFSPDYIRKTSLMHSLKTDSAFRFERGTDPLQTVTALKRAALLIKELAGGKISSEIVDVYPTPIEPVRVAMKFRNIDRLIGKSIPKDEMLGILDRLDISVVDLNDKGFIAVVPPYRVDVTRDADVIEEILRIYGYDNIELRDHASSDFLAEFPQQTSEFTQLKASTFLVDNGFFEISTNSLTKPGYAGQAPWLNEESSVTIINQLSEDLGVLRQSLLYSGLEVIAHNINRKQSNLKLFEFGKTYQRSEMEGYKEKNYLGIWMTGENHEESWMSQSKSVEFHDLASALLSLISKFSNESLGKFPLESSQYTYGLSLLLKQEAIANLGLLDKNIAKSLGIEQAVFYAELDFERLLSLANVALNVEELSKFPAVRRDLSLVIDKSITFEQVKALTEDKEFSNVLQEINVFDFYVGEKIEKDKKAYALSFILQDKNKTLTDKVIDKIMRKLRQRFEDQLGAIIRQ